MSTPTVREQFLVISALGPNPMELANVLSRAAFENRCAVVTSRLSRHGETSALVLQVGGSWDALARLEGPCRAWQEARPDPRRGAQRDQEVRPQALMPAYVSAAYRPDIINELCQFFLDHRVELEAMTCDTYLAPQTGSSMLNAQFTVILPAGTQISWLRDQFLDFADPEPRRPDRTVAPTEPNVRKPTWP
jgi:glycine cleavage system transcriptional repressor